MSPPYRPRRRSSRARRGRRWRPSPVIRHPRELARARSRHPLRLPRRAAPWSARPVLAANVPAHEPPERPRAAGARPGHGFRRRWPQRRRGRGLSQRHRPDCVRRLVPRLLLRRRLLLRLLLLRRRLLLLRRRLLLLLLRRRLRRRSTTQDEQASVDLDRRSARLRGGLPDSLDLCTGFSDARAHTYTALEGQDR